MRYYLSVIFLCLAGCVFSQQPAGMEKALERGPQDFLEQAVVGPQGDGTYVVPTTQIVDPAGKNILFPGRPTGLAVNPDETILAVKNNVNVVFINIAEQTIRQTLPMENGGNSFHGIAWSRDGKTVWTTSSQKHLCAARLGEDGTFQWDEAIELAGPQDKDNSVPGGFAIDEARGFIYVALSRNNTVGVVDVAARKLVEQIPVGIAPYDVLIHNDKAYVTNWGGHRPREGELTGATSGSMAVINAAGIAASGTVSVVNLKSRQTIGEIEVDLHPSGMALSPDGSRLYVANANSDTISVIDTNTDTIEARWLARPMAELPFGSAPNALAVSPEGSRLYAALAGNNCIGVMDTKTGKVTGLIPTGWYPGDIRITGDGKYLYVANTKGVGSLSKKLQENNKSRAYSVREHMGSVTIVAAPDAGELSDYTYRSAVNMRLPRMKYLINPEASDNRIVPIPTKPGETSVFKHVLYIIKENRTYDQVFGDLPQGNGDPNLCHFGREVTPNHHALVEEFVLLDNFYCNGVLSADGHQWTDEGYVTDYLEKSFGGFTRSYPYEGDDVLAYASSGFIWDHVLRAGLTFRDYGEMVKAHIEPAEATWADVYQDYLKGTKTVKIWATTQVRGLENYICPTAVGFPIKVQDVYRAREFIKELHEAEAKGQWYNFIIMLLPNDHTIGTREGYPTPRATVADNDLALGQIVEAVSHSMFWPETAIFVVEDDPQAGLDHVDGHRTVGLCISPYTKRGYVDSTHYNQSSMLRTIELILGLSPMNQFNMAANPMLHCFSETPDFTAYSAKPNNIPLDEMNPPIQSLRGKQRYYAQKSMEMPFDDVDQADEEMFNRILWHAVKGYDVPYPQIPAKQ